jgi:hypothetical protein
MGVDQHRDHALGLVRLDESHSAHVRRQIVDGAGALAGGGAGRVGAQVIDNVLGFGTSLQPLAARLQIDRADAAEALLEQMARQPAADKSTGPGDNNEIILANAHGHLLHSAARGMSGHLQDDRRLAITRRCDTLPLAMRLSWLPKIDKVDGVGEFGWRQ